MILVEVSDAGGLSSVVVSLSMNFDILTSVWKTCEWEEGSMILLILSCGGSFNVGG